MPRVIHRISGDGPYRSTAPPPDDARMASSPGFVSRTGDNIRRARETVGLTRAEVGARLTPPVHELTVRKWEEGRGSPRRDHRRQLCAASILNTEVHTLWPPEEVADALPRATLRLLLRTVTIPPQSGGTIGGAYILTRPGEARGAAQLLDWWLAEDCGTNEDHERVLEVTGHGRDVIDVEVGRMVP